MGLVTRLVSAVLFLLLAGCSDLPSVPVPPILAVPEAAYLGPARDLTPHLLARDVVWHEVHVHEGVACVAFASFDGSVVTIRVTTFHPADGLVTPPVTVATHPSLDHFGASLAVDADGFFHLAWGAKREPRFYSRTLRAADSTAWTEPERVGDEDGTYQCLKAFRDTVWLLYRDGSHGQGWKMATRSRDGADWRQTKVVSGEEHHRRHPYPNGASQWLFEDPDHQFFAVYWTNDQGERGGERRYQRVTRYDAGVGKHHHLDGRVIGHGDGSLLPREGPFDFPGECGDVISNDFQPKHRDRGIQANRLGRLRLGIARTGKNLVVLSNVGENPDMGFPPRGLRASVFDGTAWSQRLLSFPFAEDMGADYVENVRGRDGETLWFVHRKPTDEIGQGAATDLVILRNRDDGESWTFEPFTDDDARWTGSLKAAWCPDADRYVLAWGEIDGDLPLRKGATAAAWRNTPPGAKGYDLLICVGH